MLVKRHPPDISEFNADDKLANKDLKRFGYITGIFLIILFLFAMILIYVM